ILLSSLQMNFIPDFIVIDEGDLHFKKDINIPVIYYHKYLHRPLSVLNPDIVLFEHEEYKKYYEKFVSQDALSKTRYNGVMYPAINNEIYKGKVKQYHGICGLGYRRSFEQWLKAEEIAKEPHIMLMKQEVEEFKINGFQMGFKYFESPISDDQYRDLLPKIDVLWFPIARNQYITQRMLEAMACKTMCIFKLESERHEQILKDMGYINGVHYIGINDISEIKRSYSLQERASIIQEAYKQTLRNHTYTHRARYLYDLYNIYLRTTRMRKRTPKILDLGCGIAKTKGAYGIDNVNLEGVDLVYNLNKIPYPFDDSSVDTIIMNDVLEHLNKPVDVIQECHRILKEDGKLYIKVVYFSHKYAWGDPQHKHAFSEVYFTHFLKKHPRSYVYDFHFSDITISFINNDKGEKQAMEVTLIK
ncbi:MAG: methyltransferase domain-containing protein, partial [Candidatus Thorarchaeota archaeon]